MGVTVARPFYMIQVSQNMGIVNDGIAYLRICCCCSIGLFLQIAFERVMQGTGKTVYTMATQMTGALINIILDPMFIFGIGIFPKWGVGRRSGSHLHWPSGLLVSSAWC